MSKKLISDLEKALAEAKSKEAEKANRPPRSTKVARQKRQAILDYLAENGSANSYDINTVIGVKKGSTASLYYLGDLVKEDKIEFINTRPRTYSLKGTGTAVLEKWASDVLEFASKNVNKRFSVYGMADILNIPRGSIYRAVNALQKRNLLAKDFNMGSEPLESATETAPVEATVELKAGEEPTETKPKTDELFVKVEFLVWLYVKETRDTDLLHFLTWLENRSK